MPIVDIKRKNETELKREKDEEERNDAKDDNFGRAHLSSPCNKLLCFIDYITKEFLKINS